MKRLFCAQRALQSMNEIMCKGILHINEFCFFFFTFAKDIHFTRVFVITANFVFYFQRDSIECKSTLQIDWLANLMRNYYEIVGIPVSTFPFKEMHFLWFYFVFFFFFSFKKPSFCGVNLSCNHDCRLVFHCHHFSGTINNCWLKSKSIDYKAGRMHALDDDCLFVACNCVFLRIIIC